MVLPDNIEIDTEKGTATIPLDRYKQLYVAEKRYNWVLKEARENSICYSDVNPHSDQTYIKLGWSTYLTLNEAIDTALREEQKL